MSIEELLEKFKTHTIENNKRVSLLNFFIEQNDFVVHNYNNNLPVNFTINVKPFNIPKNNIHPIKRSFEERPLTFLFSSELFLIKYLTNNNCPELCQYITFNLILNQKNINFILDNSEVAKPIIDFDIPIQSENKSIPQELLEKLYKEQEILLYNFINNNKLIIKKSFNLQKSLFPIIKNDKKYKNIINKYFVLVNEEKDIEPIINKKDIDNGFSFSLNYFYMIKVWGNDYNIRHKIQLLFTHMKSDLNVLGLDIKQVCRLKVNRQYDIDITNILEKDKQLIENYIKFYIDNDLTWVENKKELIDNFITNYLLNQTIHQTKNNIKTRI